MVENQFEMQESIRQIEKWTDFLYEPTQNWKKRQSNILLNLVAAVVIICVMNSTQCGAALHIWCAGYLLLQGYEQTESEVRERL
jgi:hypothetical protein